MSSVEVVHMARQKSAPTPNEGMQFVWKEAIKPPRVGIVDEKGFQDSLDMFEYIKVSQLAVCNPCDHNQDKPSCHRSDDVSQVRQVRRCIETRMDTGLP